MAAEAKNGKEKWLGRALVIGTAGLFILIWYLIAANTSPLIMPSPESVAIRLVSGQHGPSFHGRCR